MTGSPRRPEKRSRSLRETSEEPSTSKRAAAECSTAESAYADGQPEAASSDELEFEEGEFEALFGDLAAEGNVVNGTLVGNLAGGY